MAVDQEEILKTILPYKLNAVNACEAVLNEIVGKELPQETLIVFDRKIRIVGNGAAFINPIFEIGLIHCRCLFEFLGLKVSSHCSKKLVPRKNKAKPDDIYIEHIKKNGISLKMVSVEEARSGVRGREKEVEEAFALTCYWANKGIAHITQVLPHDPETVEPIINGVKGVQAMVLHYVYDALDLPHPDYKVKLLDKEVTLHEQF